MALDELVAAVIETDIRGKIMAREDDFEKLFKCASKVSSEYDNETAAMIQQLHKTRDEQVKSTVRMQSMCTVLHVEMRII